jgi:protein-tyrosine phosphatase
MPKRRLACLVAVLAVRLAWADVTDATVEQTSPHRYHLTFHAEPVGGPVSIFASHTPSNREDEKPVAMTSGGSSDVHLHGWTGRPYFHLTTPGGKTRVVSIRRLPLEGQNNFRDLGGYRTTDGRYTRWGRLYRSGQLSSLTEKDYEYLQPLGIRLVCDFRTEEERSRQPTHWPGDAPEFLFTPIGADDKGRNTRVDEMRRLLQEQAGPDQMRAFMRTLYPDMAVQAATQFQRILGRLLSAQGASMVHCSAGKDRTGVFSALLLLTLGVPRETVIEDYLLTNRYVSADDAINRTALAYQKLAGLDHVPSVDVLKPLVRVEPPFLESALEAIDKHYGSFDQYRREKLHFSDADVERLRSAYLEP